jgi:hypothetical protein
VLICDCLNYNIFVLSGDFMAGKIQKTVVGQVNGVDIEQRSADGFINATAMCAAHGKDINDWFTTNDTFELFLALAADLDPNFNSGILRNLDISKLSGSKYSEVFVGLIFSKRGSPNTGGGTWLHPDLAIQLAQWCSKPFAILISRKVQEWLTTGRNPVTNQADLDRIRYRSNLKDEARLRMTGQVKTYLEQIKRYDDKKYAGIYFARVHDALNIAITGETAKQMRERLANVLNREVKESELIRDYFPAMDLQRYISLCESATNHMIEDDLNPLEAVEKATIYALPAGYAAQPIDFEEHIKLVHKRFSTGQVEIELPEG